MTIKTIILPVQAVKLTVNHIPNAARIDTSEAVWKLLFSATQTQYAMWQFRMPQDYVSGSFVIKLIYTMMHTEIKKVNMEVEIMALSGGESDPDVTDFDSVNEMAGGTVVPDIVGKVGEITISCPNDDSVAADDLVIIRVSRDYDDINDTAVGDLELRTVSFEYVIS